MPIPHRIENDAALRLVFPPSGGWVIRCTRPGCPWQAETATEPAAVQALGTHLSHDHWPEHLKKGA